ncbi:alpha-glucuronidase family glycosyl hydrolase [Tenggerimyces flavus]|uniref:Xylan alpha-1,2-glucuronidase n=1 Tax=Tenggerimyces flavus TaxID=1708749 RepID=A0ABV7YHL7_9ACTN|nr:alpha-glucuronidase family glycosyl hydrolase [Tenggerimyces flavus]MBM7784715.1 alpha-glucuronidase [Tenggerimyces flavus]
MNAKWTRRRLLGTSAAVAAGTYLLDQQAAWAALTTSADEDGHELWLRYRQVDEPRLLASYRRAFTQVVKAGDGVLASAQAELVRGLSGLLGRSIGVVDAPTRSGAVVLGTPESSPIVRSHCPAAELEKLGPEGYVVRRARVGKVDVVLVASAGERGVLYGAFHLLRLLQTQRGVEKLNVAERPANPLRLANHWDNLDGSVERGYSGTSIFHWYDLPEIKPHYVEYARAMASVGINATVVNNVNANAEFLSSEMIEKLAPLADTLRAWGIKLQLSANFASPMVLDGLETADPFDPAVRTWWRDKATEIYTHIPDFGGFLVKANSEGQPGPVDYGRTHADGANLLAEALEPHGGIVIWRAFVWHGPETWADEAFETFQPLDGEFAANALVQIKNGPIDFQVREPAHPLFGALPRTNSMMELQVTQEYTGQSTHLCYAVPLWKEVYDFDTHGAGPGTTVASVVGGTAFDYGHSGVAGVMNFGSSTNWTGHHLAAANTHGFGRLAWNPQLSAEQIADEWVRSTFGSHRSLVTVLTGMLLHSREIYESYNSPLGAGFVQGGGDHLDPCVRCNEPWHQSDASGVGFDRTVATGTGTTGHYFPAVTSVFESLDTCPDELLLFFHHVPYTHRLRSGKTVIQHIYDSHFSGLENASRLRSLWQGLRRQVDPRRHREVLARFDRQVDHARQWRDTLVTYWFEKSRILDRRRSWVQAQFGPMWTVLHESSPAPMELTVGNATSGALSLAVAVDVPEGWTSATVDVDVPSRELVPVSVPVQPGGPPGYFLVGVRMGARKDVLVDPIEVLTTPAASRCVLALDAGTAASPLHDGYRRLTPSDAWNAEVGYGWVGTAPESRDRTGNTDALLRDFVNDNAASTLRIAVPAGAHDAYLLVGDADVRSFATYVRVDGKVVAESPFLFRNDFAWLHVPLDGGASGRSVDLELSSAPNEHWHLVALALIAQKG